MKALLGLASIATILVACWLFSVIVFVLPHRDPARIPMWTGVAIGLLIYSGLCFAYLWLGPRARVLQAGVLLLSVAAMGIGGWAVWHMLTAQGRHFEGYLVLIGLILTCHGIIAFASAARPRSANETPRP